MTTRGLPFAIALCAFTLIARSADSAASTTSQPAPVRANALDRATIERILTLDCEHLSASDVHDVLSHATAPRIILLQGSFVPVTMQPFGEFLVSMGYPEEAIRDPRDGAWSMSSFGSSTTLAGTLAWYYERDAMMPMLVGHSQGGMLVLRTLHELAGEFGASIDVWDPVANVALPRSTIVDPYSGENRSVIGLAVPYATAIATGKLMRVLLGQWTMIPLLRKVPDTVVDFTGFVIEWDPIAGTFPGAERYHATGTAAVRNVTLPSSYSHIDLPRTQHLAINASTRAWIEAYTPQTDFSTAPDGTALDTSNLLHAADIWYSVKKHWCRALQHLLRDRPAQ